MYPHERSLVKKHSKDSFVIIGVNSDKKERLKTAKKKNGITWRSFWDGGNTRGPIARKWGVTGWPTIYVIDAKGVIRYKNVRGKSMDVAIEKLLAEMKEKKTDKGEEKTEPKKKAKF